MKNEDIEQYLQEVGSAYTDLNGPYLTIGICGGAALLLLQLANRTTKDIDLLYPVTLPTAFEEACRIVGTAHKLSNDWINLDPKGLFEAGLPAGFYERAAQRTYGPNLEVQIASRLDQIHFKTYAAADRAGYHVDDLLNLAPTSEEMLTAARWCLTHDVSPEFRNILRSMLTQLGFSDAASQL